MINFVPLTMEDIGRLERWFDDLETKRRLGGMLPLEQTTKYALEQPEQYPWLVFDGDMPVGYIEVELEESTAWIAILVAREHRRKGHGRAMLEALTKQPELRGTKRLAAGVDVHNEASRRLFASAGFAPEGAVPDEHDMLTYVRHIP